MKMVCAIIERYFWGKKFLVILCFMTMLCCGCFRYAYKPPEANEVNKETKKSFTIMGKISREPIENIDEWFAPFWDSISADLDEVKSSLKKDKDENPAYWGVIRKIYASDKSPVRLEYAGCLEVEESAAVQQGWKKYLIPKQQYFVVRCDSRTRGYFYNQMTETFISQSGYELIGDVLEYYPAKGVDLFYMYFPVKKSKKKQSENSGTEMGLELSIF